MGTGARPSVHREPAGHRVADVLPVVTALALVLVALVSPRAVEQAAPTLAVGGILLGVPHGAVDHLVPGWLTLRAPRGAWIVRVVSGYLGVALLATIALLLAPDIAVGVFLLVSALHFGWGEVAFAAERRGRPVPPLRGNSLPPVAHGLAVVGLPLLQWPEISRQVLAPLAPHLGDLLTARAGPSSVLVVLAVVGAAAASLVRKGRHHEAGELLLVTVLFALVTPLAAFGVYFGLWHAVRHTSRLLPLIDPDGPARRRLTRYAAAAAAPTLLATVALAVVAAGLSTSARGEPVVGAGLAVLLALTFPHVGVVALLDRSRGACSRAG